MLWQPIVLLSLAVLIAAAEPTTLGQSLSAKPVSGVPISPDRRCVACLVTQADLDEDKFVSQVWIARAASGETYQLTSGKKSGEQRKMA